MKYKNKKGLKIYGVCSPESDHIICCDSSIESAKKSLDSNYSILVEATVTRVFTRERELHELENDPIK